MNTQPEQEVYTLLLRVLATVPSTQAAHTELARQLGTSVRTLYRWRHPGYRRPRYLGPALREYLATHK